MQARRRMRAAMVVALGAAAVLPALAASAGSASASALGPDPALSGTPNPSWWGTNGRVMDILPVGNRVYLAGGFDYVGPATGYGVGVDAAAGIKLPGAPVIDGVVRAAVADGQGGWFIGGDFKNVGGQYRRYAAQVTAAGAVTAWNPKPDQPVEALAFDGTTVFLGGAFTTVRDAPAPRLAAVAPTGAANLVPGFQPAPDGRVTSLLLSGGALFAGGEFGAIGGAPHARVARLDRATGAASAAFTAGTDQPVRALAASPDGTTIYAGGDFGQAGGAGRARLAAFDATTGALLPWAPSADDVVRALAVDPASGVVAAGGQFRSVSGVARGRLALIDGAGTVLPFDAALNGCQTRHTTSDAHSNPACDTEVDALTAANGVLYVGGRFSRSGTTSRHDVAAFTLANGALHGWNPVASDRVLALAGSGGGVFVGGELTSVNGGVRPNLAALDAATGQLDPSFNPVVDDEVLDIAVAPDGTRLYLAGHFSTVGGKKHNRMAAVSLATGAEDKAFKPNFNNDVLSIGVVGQSVYVGGQFTKVTKVTRKHVAKIDPVTGAADPAFVADTVGPERPAHRRRHGAVPPGRARRLQGLPRRAVQHGQRRGQAGHRRGRRDHRGDAAPAARRRAAVLGQRRLDHPPLPVTGRAAPVRRRRLPRQHLPVGRRAPVDAGQPDRAQLADVVQRRHAGHPRGERPLLLRQPRRRQGEWRALRPVPRRRSGGHRPLRGVRPGERQPPAGPGPARLPHGRLVLRRRARRPARRR